MHERLNLGELRITLFTQTRSVTDTQPSLPLLTYTHVKLEYTLFIDKQPSLPLLTYTQFKLEYALFIDKQPSLLTTTDLHTGQTRIHTVH